jgi:hypothetical protein
VNFDNNGILIALKGKYIKYPILMKKIKESFFEVVAGEPHKEHYIKVSIVTVSLSVIVALVLVIGKTLFFQN